MEGRVSLVSKNEENTVEWVLYEVKHLVSYRKLKVLIDVSNPMLLHKFVTE